MAPQATTERVSASELEEGDTVTVYVNERAATHLGTHRFEAEVSYVGFSDVQFEPVEELQPESETHTWYSDIGYIHGFHDGLGRHSDIGKVRKVER